MREILGSSDRVTVSVYIVRVFLADRTSSLYPRLTVKQRVSPVEATFLWCGFSFFFFSFFLLSFLKCGLGSYYDRFCRSVARENGQVKARHRCFGRGGAAAIAFRAAYSRIANTRLHTPFPSPTYSRNACSPAKGTVVRTLS